MNIFIAGPRAVTKLDDSVENRLYNIFANNITVLVGDANGVDRSIQQYFHDLAYKNVIVFSSGEKLRNNVGNWKIKAVEVPRNVKGFDFYAEKDKAMAKDADYGFMIWNGKSKGTLNNIINLVSDNKKVLVYFMPNNKFLSINSTQNLETLISYCGEETKSTYEQLIEKSAQSAQSTLCDIQISLFENKA